MTECKNDCCITCGKHKSKIKGMVWHGKKTKYDCSCETCKQYRDYRGIQCMSCREKEQEQMIKDYRPVSDTAHKLNANPVCPYCGYEDEDSEAYLNGDVESIEDCPQCDSRYNVKTNIEVTYTTSKLKETENGSR